MTAWQCPSCGSRIPAKVGLDTSRMLSTITCACGYVSKETAVTQIAAGPPLPEATQPTEPSDAPPRVEGEVIGFRSWQLDGYKLRSANAWAGHWTIGVNEAVCKYREQYRSAVGLVPREVTAQRGSHDAPERTCGCGLYAYHEPQLASFPGDESVWGAVKAWGKLEVHHGGFRAQYAEPVALAYHQEQSYRHVEKLKAVAGELGLPLVEASDLQQAAAQYGKPVGEELRPPNPYPVVIGSSVYMGAPVGASVYMGPGNYAFSSGGWVSAPAAAATASGRGAGRSLSLGRLTLEATARI